MAAQQHLLESEDIAIGRALAGLAKTLEAAGKLEEAATYARQCLAYLTAYEGPDSFYAISMRLELAQLLNKLGRNKEAP